MTIQVRNKGGDQAEAIFRLHTGSFHNYEFVCPEYQCDLKADSIFRFHLPDSITPGAYLLTIQFYDSYVLPEERQIRLVVRDSLSGIQKRRKTAYAFDTLFPSYFQNNSELPDRVVWINNRLKQEGLLDSLLPVMPINDPEFWIESVHTPEHIRGIQSIPVAASYGATRRIGEIATLAVAHVLGAVGIVMEGTARNAFANIRPPGHHVVNDAVPIGFCAYANAVIAATYARQVYGIERILIVDWDYHYGNSTETFFCDDTAIFLAEFAGYYSEPSQCNKASRHMITYNIEQGYNVNYLQIFQDSLSLAMKEFRPELILVSCGFDLKEKDGLGSNHVTAAGISALTKSLMDIADEHCGGKVVSILEGGYHDRDSNPRTWHGLSQCAENHVRTLMTGAIAPETDFFRIPSPISFRHGVVSRGLGFSLTGVSAFYDIRGRRIGSWGRDIPDPLNSPRIVIRESGKRRSAILTLR
jgi:acetoin utilization deacetylase AcuC-like enzyme